MLVIAHRGANREAAENTFAAFDKAIEGGAVRIELDVQLSRDGHAVVMHDDDLSRMTGYMGRCSQMTRAEIAKLKVRGTAETVPFLDEVVARVLPRAELNIEIKGKNEALADAVATLVGKHALRERVIVSSFDLEPLARLRRVAPELERACLMGGGDTLSWPSLGLLAPPVFMERAGAATLHPHVEMVDENLMDQAGARRWRVYGWATMAGEESDREGLWTYLKTVGLHGLCTNYPRQLRRWLEDASEYDRAYRKGR
jgi:glycerophosphoryl diester phosphodiesterase